MCGPGTLRHRSPSPQQESRCGMGRSRAEGAASDEGRGGGPAHWWKGDPGRGGSASRGTEALRSGEPGEGRLRQGEEPLPASCCRGSLPLRLCYKTWVGMTTAPAATSSVRDPRLGSHAGCGCCWRSWSSPPPRPRPVQVNEGFGPGTPRWPLSGPSELRPRAQAAPARDAAARAAGRGGRRGTSEGTS